MNKIFLFFLFFSLSFLGFSQNKKIDSLKNILLKSQLNDSSKVDIYNALATAYIPINIDSTEKFAKIGLQKSLLTNKYGIVIAYCNRGTVLDIKTQPDSARYYYDKAIIELDKNNNKKERAIVYTNYSMTYQNSDRMDLALDYNAKAIELSKDDDKEIGLLYYNQAILYLRSEMPNIGKKYLKLAYESSKKVNDYRVEGAAIQSLSYAYSQEKKLDSARIYLEKGLSLCERTKSPETCFRSYSSLGELYIQMKLESKAEIALLKAKEYAVIRNKPDDILLSLAQLGELENRRNNFEKSSQYFHDFESLYKEEGKENVVILSNTYKVWSDTEYNRNNYKKSHQLLKQHIRIKDSILTLKNKELLNEANAKFETEIKDKIILEKELKLEKSQAKTQLMSLLIISLLIASLLLWFIFQQRQKRIQQQLISIKKEQEVRTLESLIEGEEKERLRIAKELHDGVNGDLSAIKYKLSSLLKMNNEVITEAVAMIDNSCKQVRAISHNLVPPSLKDFNIIEAIENYCENMDGTHIPEISFQHIGETINLNKKVEVNIFRIIQELVTNAVKHANATTIDVQISNRNNILIVTVEDNGSGYTLNEKNTTGIGLSNIKSRVEYLNATLDVITNEKGTFNTVEIDVENIEK